MISRHIWPVGVAFLVGIAGTPASLAGQSDDSLLVEIRLTGVGAVMVMAATEGATLRVPTAPIYALAGLDGPGPESLTLEALGTELGVEVGWSPRRLLVVIRDLFQVLPASRARLDRLRAEAQAMAGNALYGRRIGPFGAFTVDDRGAMLGELGYSLGRAQARVTHSTESGTAWSASANPLSSLWLNFHQSALSGTRLGARLALERSWVSATYGMGRLGIDGAASFGPVVVYASSRDRFSVTWRGDVDIQVGHAGERSAIRMSFGPLDPSPLSVPAVF